MKRIPILFSGLIILSILLSACTTTETDHFSASGTFSAVDTSIASELSGRVTQVNVTEGQTVKDGQVLFELESEIYQAQYDQAAAAVSATEAAVEASRDQAASADAQYQLALQAALMQEATSQQTTWTSSVPEDYQAAWYFNDTERIAAAQTLIENMQSALDTALADLKTEQEKASNKDFIAAEERLAVAEVSLSVAESTLTQADYAGDDNLKDAALEIQDAAQAEFDSALSEYERMLTTSAADAILDARSRVAVAQASLDNARTALLSLQTGDQSLQVIAAQKAADAATSAVNQAEAGLEQAQQAQTLAQLQLDRTQVTSPVDGIVLTRSVEVGDLAVAGGTVMRVANIDSLDLVVYLPEDQYGKVSLGDEVYITVDSYPDETFEGTIIQIADEAEFTPKNVQTESGRKSTVYAIKIQVQNADHRLKPGMPADVEFTIH